MEGRYTAREMRHTAMSIHSHIVTKPSDIVFDSTLCDAVAMLCQGADAEEENSQLKARLEAVVKIAESNMWCEDSGVVETDTCAKLHNSYMSDILRVARGEGGSE